MCVCVILRAAVDITATGASFIKIEKYEQIVAVVVVVRRCLFFHRRTQRDGSLRRLANKELTKVLDYLSAANMAGFTFLLFF